jgi:phage FluMu protein Com
MEGQNIFLQQYPDYEATTGYNKIDFIHKTDGTKVELKTDFYDMDKTANFFFERFSNHRTKTLGGPFSAAEAEVDYFIYFFIKNSRCFWFKPKELCEFLDNWKGSKSLVSVRNQGYMTLGIKCPRKLVESLYVKEEVWKPSESSELSPSHAVLFPK